MEYRRAVENRRREPDNIIPMPTTGLRRMKMAAAGVFVLLCVMALALMRQESTGESLGETARQAMSNLMEQKLPDAVEEQSQISTLVAEDKLEDALRQENAAAGNTTGTAAETAMPEGTENASMDGTGNSAVDPTEENTGSVADGTSAGQQCHKKYDRCDGGNRTQHDTGNNTGCDTDCRICSGRDSYSGGGCSTHTLYYPERGHTDRYFSAELRQQQ